MTADVVTAATLTIRVEGVPDDRLSPNARTSGWSKGRAVKADRSAWKLATLSLYNGDRSRLLPPPGLFCLGCRVHAVIAWPKGKSQRDDDNAWGLLKSARDGACDALGFSDRRVQLGTMTQARADKADPKGYVELVFERALAVEPGATEGR